MIGYFIANNIESLIAMAVMFVFGVWIGRRWERHLGPRTFRIDS